MFFVCAQAGTLDYQLNNPPWIIVKEWIDVKELIDFDHEIMNNIESYPDEMAFPGIGVWGMHT